MSQFAEIIDLAIEGQYVAIASVHHRLMATGAEINDAEPIVADSKTSGRVNKSSSIVWPAMGHRGHHPIKRRLIQLSLRIYQPAAYRTHSVKHPFAARPTTPLGSRVSPCSSVARRDGVRGMNPRTLSHVLLLCVDAHS